MNLNAWKVNFKNDSLQSETPHCRLIEESIRLAHAELTPSGAIKVLTGKHTGRSASDKYITETEKTKGSIWWDNGINKMSPERFENLKKEFISYLEKQNPCFHTTRSVGAHEQHYINVDVISPYPHAILFSEYLFRHPREKKAGDFLILHAPDLELDPQAFGLKSSTVIATCFDQRVTLIAGTRYAGEIKKSMFCVMNYDLPERQVLPMHAGCSQSESGESFVFFGLSGTGKTTLSTDEGTLLIGDDEHGLDQNSVFNFEGGCYAKTYKLAAETEPDIFRASNQFGSLLENVVLTEKTRKPDFFDKSISENGRSSYPLTFIEERVKESRGKLPSHLFFLTADAFGVLPPVSKLTKKQAMFYFVLGYTAKLAGTEIGVKEPQATFSACFGSPFMMRHPSTYAELLGDFLDRHEIDVWLINTGWTAGPYGVGHRFPLHTTRKVIRAIQKGELKEEIFKSEEIFGLQIPEHLDGVPESVLFPHRSWEDKMAYDKQAKELALSFHEQMKHFPEFYAENKAGAPVYFQ